MSGPGAGRQGCASDKRDGKLRVLPARMEVTPLCKQVAVTSLLMQERSLSEWKADDIMVHFIAQDILGGFEE